MVSGLSQILFKPLLVIAKHILNTLIQQILNLNALLLSVLNLVLGYDLNDIPLVFSHRFQNVGDTILLIVIFGSKQIWLVVRLAPKRLESVHLHRIKVEAIQLGIVPETGDADVVDCDDQRNLWNGSEF